MWKKDKEGYKTWLEEKIKSHPERSHGSVIVGNMKSRSQRCWRSLAKDSILLI